MRHDLLAGLAVGIIAVPLALALALALAIASGVPPQHGLGGLLVATFMAGMILVAMGWGRATTAACAR